MKFIFSKDRVQKTTGKKVVTFLLVILTLFSLLVFSTDSVNAQAIVTDPIMTTVTTEKSIWDKIKEAVGKLWQKAGSYAYQRTLSAALNKIAYDAANYIGSGRQGQKPLFITEGWDKYLLKIGDEAAGQFLESFVNQWSVSNQRTKASENCAESYEFCLDDCYNYSIDNTELNACLTSCSSDLTACTSGAANSSYTPSFNVCQPSSLEAKVRIGLGLAEQSRPSGPNCSASTIVNNWGNDITAKYKAISDGSYLENFANVFDPRFNDVGIYVLARTDLSSKAIIDTKNAENSLIANKGWVDQRDIAGNLIGTPGEAQRNLENAKKGQSDNIANVTGDILVDTANVFLNQLAITAFNTLTKSLGQKVTNIPTFSSVSSYRYESDPNVVYGETALKEVTSKLLEAKFSERADYEILSALSICTDKNNPGPDNCVIDTQFMQAISEQKTVGEAMDAGLLHGDWQFTDTYIQNNYSSRNLSILRKYRIIPVGWEVAIEKAYADPLKIKKATLSDLVSCFDPNDTKYYRFSSSFDRKDTGWCAGLVDPNWVLKAPLNYCRKSGFSGQIISTQVVPGIKNQPGVSDTLNTLNVVRAEEYCADGMTCIKETKKGACDVYGYCSEEKKTWNFDSDSCNPVYNTCQSFTNTESGQSAAYLENTLNYAGCTSENSGCHQYSLFGLYATTTAQVSWSSAWSLYLNNKLGACNSKDEGCTELIRVRPAKTNGTTGSNLIMNSDFRNDSLNASSTTDKLNDWPLVSTGNHKATIVDAGSDPGGYSGKTLKLEGSGTIGIESSNQGFLVPTNLQIMAGQAYTLSADVYLKQGTDITIAIGAGSDKVVKTLTDKNAWRRISVTRFPSDTYNEPVFSLVGSGGSVVFYLKNLKFEMSSWDTGYSVYAANKIYEKLLPPYLEAACYVNGSGATKDYSLKSDAPAVCSKYVRKCNKNEVGCELYKDNRDGFSVPAQATDQDVCPAECVGYDVYVSKETYFNPAQAENLIPSTAKECSANSAGCNEFTNLDELARGGEAKEYYTYLKQCIKPSTTACGSFYAWEGTASGYQLKAYSLQKNGESPAVTAPDDELCNAEIYNSPVGTTLYNSDCREFYNTAGQVFYHLNSRVITCSDNCHAYRLTAKNIDKRLTAAQCSGADKHWDSSLNDCYVCQNGGTWDVDQGACIYQAIPGEGLKCSASESGCREYNGNSGNNVRLAAYYNFENDLNGWYSNCSAAVTISPVANSKNGHSLQYDNDASGCGAVGQPGPVAKRRVIEALLANDSVAAQLNVNGLVRKGLAYNIKFMARATEDADVKIYLLNTATQERDSFNAGAAIRIKGGNEWNVYQASLDNVNHTVGLNEILALTANQDIFIDDFILSEITDRYYLIKDSSQIAPVCYYDELDNYQGAEYNLGCSAYTDRSGATHYFHKFSRLCANSAVGCEQMIDTKNYASSGTGIWNDKNKNNVCDGDEPDCVKVSGDSALYAVYDPSKQCSAADQGCSRLGQAQGEGNNIVWFDVYKKNNPNKYQEALCAQEDIGCEEWQTSDGGLSYFKNPGFNVCTYRNSQDPSIIGKNWYKTPVKRCDLDNNGKIEGKEQDGSVCATGGCGDKPCIVDNNDYYCSVSYLKTMGQGGGGNQIATPDKSVGLCEASAAGCTEYIDPVSQFSPNVIYNPSYQKIGDKIEGWGETSQLLWKGATLSGNRQAVAITPNKLYILTVESTEGDNKAEVKLEFIDNVRPLITDFASSTNPNNIFGTSTASTTLPAFSASQPKAIIFHSTSNTKVLVSGGSADKTIVLREAVTDYQLKSAVDKKSCTVVNFDEGCVLFNERSVNGGKGITSLNLNAFLTADGQSIIPCDTKNPLSCTANTLLKVRPDRTCGKWLSCTSYTQNPETKKPDICYTVSECDRLDDKGDCANFTSVATTSERLFDSGRDRNASGYSIINEYYLSQMKEVGLNSEAHYDFEETIPSLSCRRDVEFNGGTAACVFDKDGNISKDSIIREPSAKAVDYPAHGRSYLKVPAAYQISPLGSDNYISLDTSTASSSTYYLNLLVNTRGSGLGAKIIITGKDNPAKALTDNILKNQDGSPKAMVFYATANNGWERKVFKFNLKSPETGGKDKTDIRIYLTSDLRIDANQSPKGDNYVYFDDINIEPVLEIGKDQYAARECRLYPSADSLACVNKDNNSIQNGLEGYCLEHDSANPNVCLTWYPVDKISATNNKSSLGYSGKAPLNYCAAVNGNFTLVEKREAKKILDTNLYDKCGICDDGQCGENGTWCFFPKDTSEEEIAKYPVCGKINDRAFNFGSFSNGKIGTAWDDWGEGSGDWKYKDYFSCGPNTNTGSPDYFLMVQRWRDCAKDTNNPTGTNHFDYCVACIPLRDGAPGVDPPLLSTTQDAIKCETHGNILEVPQNAGWYEYNGLQCSPGNDCAFIDEAKSADPPVRVYNYENPPQNENSLKYISGNDEDKTFRLACEKFFQVVENNGDNKAWTSRISKMTDYPVQTPAFFLDEDKAPYYASPYLLNRYGRNREDVPFGAAAWPEDLDLLSSPPITLRDQYSKKNKEESYAGRPYGCIQGGQSNGCQLIGSCSLDPSAFCLVDGAAAKATSSNNNYVRIETCAANGLGTCVPLWSTSTKWLRGLSWYSKTGGEFHEADSVNILKTLFLKAYNSFAISDNGTYVSTSTYNKTSELTICSGPGGSRPADSGPASQVEPGKGAPNFCAVYPKIFNVQLYVGNSQAKATSTSNSFEAKKGIYRLEFNTLVDVEQQPLRRIVIDWGDNKYQVVTDQDQRPSADNKHIFYHYYAQTKSYPIRIRAYDNWDFSGRYYWN